MQDENGNQNPFMLDPPLKSERSLKSYPTYSGVQGIFDGHIIMSNTYLHVGKRY